MKAKMERMKQLKADMEGLQHKKQYMNYSIQEGKMFGVPIKGQELYKGAMESIDNLDDHKQFLETKIEMLDIQASIFNYSDGKLNKQLDNVKLYFKRFNNAMKKLEKQTA
jgi:hypothetical protein